MESEGITFEIFSNLPAQVLSKFKAVSKGCKELADEDLFLKKQCEKMQSRDDRECILQPHHYQIYNDKVELHSLQSNESSVSVPKKSLEFLTSKCRVLASSNGLLVCRDISDQRNGSLFICNPATQTWQSISPPSGLNNLHEFKIVFECNSRSGKFPHDYTLVIVMEQGEWGLNSLSKTYSPRERMWKENGEVNFGRRSINFEMPIFHNGAVHFVTDCFPYLAKESPFYWPYIVALNIKDGSSKFLRLPKNSRKGSDDMTCRLGIFNWESATSSFKSICLVKLRKTKCCVWFLADYNSSTWVQILRKRVRAMGFREPNPTIAGFTILNGASLLLATAERVYSYDLARHGNGKVEFVSQHRCGGKVVFHSYSNTLRPCGNGAASISTF